MLEKLSNDLKEAMKAGDKTRVSVLRLLLAACKNKQIENRADLSDAEVLGVLAKQAKQREDSIAAYQKADRADLVEEERAELEIIKSYLPAPLSQEEISALVDEALQVTGAVEIKQMRAVMSYLSPKIKGRADGGEVSRLVREKLEAG